MSDIYGKRKLEFPHRGYHEISNVGKTVASSKQQVRWRFAFGPTGEEHEVTLVHSKASGKKKVYLDRRMVHEATQMGISWDYSWSMGPHLLRIDIGNGALEYDFSADGVSFMQMASIADARRNGHSASNNKWNTGGSGAAAPRNAAEEEAELERALRESKKMYRSEQQAKKAAADEAPAQAAAATGGGGGGGGTRRKSAGGSPQKPADKAAKAAPAPPAFQDILSGESLPQAPIQPDSFDPYANGTAQRRASAVAHQNDAMALYQVGMQFQTMGVDYSQWNQQSQQPQQQQQQQQQPQQQMQQQSPQQQQQAPQGNQPLDVWETVKAGHLVNVDDITTTTKKGPTALVVHPMTQDKRSLAELAASKGSPEKRSVMMEQPGPTPQQLQQQALLMQQQQMMMMQQQQFQQQQQMGMGGMGGMNTMGGMSAMGGGGGGMGYGQPQMAYATTMGGGGGMAMGGGGMGMGMGMQAPAPQMNGYGMAYQSTMGF